jgi:copper(I)-binding protein
MKKLLALAALAGLAFFAFTQFSNGVQVSNLWAAASNVSTNARVYGTFGNKEETDDTLVAIETSAATRTIIQEETMTNGTKTFAEIKEMRIPGNGGMVMKPAGTYVFLSGLTKPLVKGDKFTLSFVFDKKGLVEREVTVEGAAATDFEKN